MPGGFGGLLPARDVDNNGGPDFVASSYLHPNSSELRVTWNDGSGLLGPVSTFPANVATVGWEMTYPYVVADIDGDGVFDVVSGTMGGAFTNPRLSCPCPIMVFLGLGNHQFVGEPFGRFGGMRLPRVPHADAGDLNGDGAIDFLFYDSGPKVFLNDGTGRFAQLPNAFPPGVFGGQFRFADLDGDGDLDYVATGASSTAAGVCLNDGTGHFPQQFLLTTSASTWRPSTSISTATRTSLSCSPTSTPCPVCRSGSTTVTPASRTSLSGCRASIGRTSPATSSTSRTSTGTAIPTSISGRWPFPTGSFSTTGEASSPMVSWCWAPRVSPARSSWTSTATATPTCSRIGEAIPPAGS
ncbi:MAG: VCBS repeat-containing protein [Planctomycetes bacterium]|nr:VCBS repeat-containing protein [Planctomycetota bacterium]